MNRSPEPSAPASGERTLRDPKNLLPMKSSPPGLRIFYRLAYGLFLLLAAYQVFLRDDPVTAAGSAGIGLVFDPFDPAQPWNQRPLWQRVWLIAHLALAAGLLGYGIGRK